MQATSTVDEHAARLQRITRDRYGLWRAIALELLSLLAFIALFNFLLPDLGSDLGTLGAIGLGMVLSLVPAALWLIFFYQLDRLEPEPKGMVFNVFVVAILLMAALQQPILQGLYQVSSWLNTSSWYRLFGGILLIGVFEQYVVYLTVRFAVFDHREFDERVDGVIYATAAGLGVATVVNFVYVINRGGVDLDVGSIRMVINALAYGSIAGVLGYFIGQVKFEKTPWYYLPSGFGIAALLNGIIFYLLDQPSRGLNVGKPWADLIVTAIIAVVLLVVVFWLISRANEETLRTAAHGQNFVTSTASAYTLEPTAAAPAVDAADSMASEVSAPMSEQSEGPLATPKEGAA